MRVKTTAQSAAERERPRPFVSPTVAGQLEVPSSPTAPEPQTDGISIHERIRSTPVAGAAEIHGHRSGSRLTGYVPGPKLPGEAAFWTSHHDIPGMRSGSVQPFHEAQSRGHAVTGPSYLCLPRLTLITRRRHSIGFGTAKPPQECGGQSGAKRFHPLQFVGKRA